MSATAKSENPDRWSTAPTAFIDVPNDVLTLLSAYAHPAFVLPRTRGDAESGFTPVWQNSACTQLQRLSEDERARWHDECAILVRSALQDPAACTALCGPYTTVVTLLGLEHVIVTTARLPDIADVSIDTAFRDELAGTGMGRHILAFTWEKTSMGALDEWLPEVKSAVLGMLAVPDCMALWYGEEHIGLYNDAYIQVLGKKHPAALGMSFKEVHAETYAELENDAFGALAGTPAYHRHSLRMVDRDESNGLQEVYYTWSYIPWRARLPTGQFAVFGFMDHAVETTSEVLTARRLQVLSSLQNRTNLATTVADFWPACISALDEDPFDIPFALLYSVRAEYNPRDKDAKEPTRYRLTLAGALGIPPGHPSARAELVVRLPDDDTASRSTLTIVDESSTPDAWPFAEVLEARGDVVLLPALGARTDGFTQRGWPHRCTHAVAFSVGAKDQPPGAVVVLGVNPCRSYNDALIAFVRMLGIQLSTGLTTVIACETQVHRAEELATLDRAKTTFFSNVSHELRTPLTLILGPLQDVLSHNMGVDSRALLEVVQRNATRLHHLVNTLLDFARLEAGRYLAQFVPVNLGNLTANYASLFRSAIERGGVEFDVDCREEGPSVYLDPDSWEKIVTNIISNAFKYCLRGRINVRVHYTRTEAIFSCKDTGCGIPQDELHNIFQRFHRVALTGRSHEGTGIGLSLAHETVKALGGRMDVESEHGKGSTFSVILPLGTEHIPPKLLGPEPEAEAVKVKDRIQPQYGARLAEEARTWLENQTSSTPLGSDGLISPALSDGMSDSTAFEFNFFEVKGDRPVVVLADDNADLRQYCTALLAPKYAVYAFSDGEAALKFVRGNEVDLILSDVEMPRLDGFGFLEAVRENIDLAFVPFILLSARAGSEARADGLNAGADDYLVKPFSSRELLARVKTHVVIGQRRRDLEARVRDRTRLLIESEGQLRLKVAEEHHMRKQQEIVVDLTSHELRNPLNASWQNAEVVEEALERLRPLVLPEGMAALDEAQDAIECIMLSVAHQTRIADDILNFSKISMQLLTIHTTAFPIFDTLQDVCRLWEVETRERNVTLELDAASDVKGTWIKSDPQRIAQITINFLLNALRFTAGCAERRITVSIRFFKHVMPPAKHTFRVGGDNDSYPDVSWMRIAVRDTGPGLTLEDLKKLFERFSQAHPSKDQFTGGHGLGLFVSRHLVVLLGGFIEVESFDGQGATFSFCIPAEHAPPVEGAPAGWRARILGRSVKPTSPISETSGTSAVPKHVLVVEDNIINQKVLVRQLKAKGFRTSTANDGQEALDLLFRSPPADIDVVLMDIEMPVKDGKTACMELRAAEGAQRRTPVIAVTGNARGEQIEECLALGFDEVAIKPYRITDVVRLIWSVLAVKHRDDGLQ